MATGKRYYWIKLKESFMWSDAVDYLMGQPNGADYVVLYQMLCLKTINTEGRLERKIGEIVIPYDIDKIVRDLKWFSVDTVRVALKLYQSFGLIYEDQDGVLILADHNNLVGSETDYAGQKKLQRQPKKCLTEPQNVGETVDNGVDNGVDIGVDIGVDNVHTDIRYKRLDIRDRDKRLDSTNTVVCTRSINLLFDKLYKNYPKRTKRDQALEEFKKIAPDERTVDAMIVAIGIFSASDQWKEQGGRYIPSLCNFLRDRQWEHPPRSAGQHSTLDTDALDEKLLRYRPKAIIG